MRTALLAIPAIVLTFSSSARSAQAQKTAPPRPDVTVNASTDSIWSAALSALADLSAPIAVSDRAGGIITTVEMNVPRADARKVADCPYAGANTVQYTVRVREGALHVMARFTYLKDINTKASGDCPSRGILESRLEQAITSRLPK